MPITTNHSFQLNQLLVSLFWKQLWLFAVLDCERVGLRNEMEQVLKTAPLNLSVNSIEFRITRLNTLLVGKFGPDAFMHSRLTASHVLYTQAVAFNAPLENERWVKTRLSSVSVIGPLVFTHVAKSARKVSIEVDLIQGSC